MAALSGGIVTLLALLAIFAPIFWGEAAATPDPTALLQSPSAAHPLGTDSLGRDLLLRTLVATRTSLVMALIATACGAVAGLILGALPAVLGVRAQRAFSAVINTWLAFPVLLVAMLTVILLGAGPATSVIALALTMTPSFARLAQTLSSRVGGSEYLAAAKMLGVSKPRQYLKYVLPNIGEPVIVNVTISIGGGLLALSSLSFLGVGIQPPEYDWGRMLNEGFAQVYSQPSAVVGPGVLVVLAGLSFGMLGEALASHMRQQGRGRMLSARKLGPAPSAKADAIEGNPVLSVPGSASGHNAGSEVQPLLEVEGLAVSFPGEEGWIRPVSNVSFSIMPGELVGVVGESGSGKSVTMMSVAQLAPANAAVTATKLKFNGQELSHLSAVEAGQVLGTQVGVIFQDSLTALNPALRVGTQLAEVPRVHEHVSRKVAHARAVAALDEVRIPEPERRAMQFPHEFSGGMRQRSLIAMAQIGSPSLIIADEPTTALDVTVQQRVLALLRAKCEETGAAAIVISHDIAVLAELCSRILVMYKGEIVENIDVRDLPHPERLQHPYSRALVECMPDLTTDRSLPLATIPEDPQYLTESVDDEHPTWERKPTQLISVVEDGAAARRGADLVVDDLVVTFGHGAKAFNAVDGVSFELASGSVLGLVGESGSGKSTVARTIAGLQPATAGRVSIGGDDLLRTAGVNRLERARDVQMIFQDPYSSLNPRMNVREVLDEVLMTHGMTNARERRTQVSELLDLVRLRANTADLYPGQMSGGMRQRVAIARCLAAKPRLIIADEITSALDASVQGAVLNLIRELQRELDISMLFITHNLAAVRYIADRTAVMQHGRIVEIADPDKLVRAPEHPYTQTLVDAIPRIDNAGTDALLRSLRT
ncbi:ABC-type glutathione transport system ATPase component/ABC-type dipeptide/oligopeptide/nickel transport system permease subunit [Leucobacter exalbidus]|uniref:ABC-type glutathione transport system ATPase component/ABC-type dipeptide/oligopeptide/nickel transport system permease subunit n=1 Tax=Leucobacter exalbidus TaxID=662960 RepID=A0A940T4H8_9MICO|nr:dipeptide ABC transporter ATP-binding protein [Leucobacter exalbidus]MBP1326943.1 ABC-type glutathione transport system ATPase component/ABC-type dipeptide/oligopeptide/nickel transport system permease subunit [Leucobacter exalbidus]